MSRAFSTELLTHQRDAIAKLGRLRVGLLFMEMGTGKTRTILEIAYSKLDAGKVSRIVWLTPFSTKGPLRTEIDKHAPWATVAEFDDKTSSESIPSADILIVGSESLSNSPRVRAALVEASRGAFVVIDESDLYRNYYANRSKALRAVKGQAAYRFAMSGTPMGKGIEDLYPIVEWLDSRIFGYDHFRQFSYYHLEWSDTVPRRITRRHGQSKLTAKMAPYVYAVTKEECLELPQKLYVTRMFSMTTEQRRAYNQFKDDVFDHYMGDPDDSMVYRLFSGLQRIVSGIKPKPVPKQATVSLAKLEEEVEAERIDEPGDLALFGEPMQNPRIVELCNTVRLIAENRKVIIWCKYTLDIEWASEALASVFGTEDVARFHGGLKDSERRSELERFRSRSRFLLATTGTGGRGLNLAEASYAVYYNNSFKFIERLQSEDRIHRIGQTLPCNYVDIAADEGIDLVIRRCLEKRESAFEAFRRETREIRKMRNKKQAKKRLERLLNNFDKETDGSKADTGTTGAGDQSVAA